MYKQKCSIMSGFWEIEAEISKTQKYFNNFWKFTGKPDMLQTSKRVQIKAWTLYLL